MKAIFYAVAILVSCGAAFFSYSHSQKFASLQKDRLATISTNKTTTTNAEAAEKNIKDEEARKAKSTERRELLTQTVSSLRSDGTKLKSDLEKLKDDLTAQEAEFAQLNKTLEEVNKILENLGGGVTLDTLPQKIEEINKDREDKQKKLEELQTFVAGAEKTLTGSRAELDGLNKRMILRNARISRNSMEAVVASVSQDWGFVVIGAGSNSGFTPQTSLLVERDGRKIGRVRPSSIEPTQTIAEIDFESLAPGVRLQPGDRVILASPTTN